MSNIYLNLEEGIGSKPCLRVGVSRSYCFHPHAYCCWLNCCKDNIQTSAPENYLLLLFHVFHGRLILVLKFSKISLVVPMVVGYFSYMKQLFLRCSWLESYLPRMFDGYNPIFVYRSPLDHP